MPSIFRHENRGDSQAKQSKIIYQRGEAQARVYCDVVPEGFLKGLTSYRPNWMSQAGRHRKELKDNPGDWNGYGNSNESDPVDYGIHIDRTREDTDASKRRHGNDANDRLHQ